MPSRKYLPSSAWTSTFQRNPNRLVYVKTETGEGHLVCEVDGWILDNRQPRVTERDLLPYQFISISGFKPGEPWCEVLA